ncbi:cytosine deaminase [Carpediemonas membranifera]|uniref:Cytosine deaminase n=1 Tax=Carpediemonas membranifera TaxID=201153 RepID=A0A8J6EA00_9EUKA|nr:cytosine deaminase [Carpediemonas membranifera]|eukprot:KAG9394045.1 cytosine deaminase [Carpediemonas membranifera]
MWRDPDITPLVQDFVTAYSYIGLCKQFDTWLGEYSTSTRVWLSRASPGYLTRLRAGLERVRPLLHDQPGVRQDFLDTLGELDTEVAAIAADHGRYHPQIHALPEGQRVGRTGTVAEALVGVLSCVTRMSAAVTKLVTLTRAVNLELSQALPEPKLVPFVPMAPVKPGFMTLERGVTALTPAMKRRLRVHVNWSATKNLTDEQVAEYERDHGDITKLRRVLSVKTDGVSVAVTVWVGREKYRGGRVADRPTYKKGSNNKRARLGQDDAEATPAPDIQALMGFDPGARSLGGYTIRRPDGQSVSGVLAKCGYTATPSFRVNMSAASFKTTSLEALKQSIRFVHENIVQIINEGTRKCFRRATFANHCLRLKHFARAGRQLLDDLGGRPPEPIHLEVAYGAALFCSAGTPSCAPYRNFARALPGIMLWHNVVVSVTMVSEFRTSIVCPYRKAHFRRVVHTHRTMLCQNPACEGAPWRVERLRRHPEQRDILLNLSHRDKSASENILWCTFDATSDQIEQSPFHYDSQRGALPRYH